MQDIVRTASGAALTGSGRRPPKRFINPVRKACKRNTRADRKAHAMIRSILSAAALVALLAANPASTPAFGEEALARTAFADMGQVQVTYITHARPGILREVVAREFAVHDLVTPQLIAN